MRATATQELVNIKGLSEAKVEKMVDAAKKLVPSSSWRTGTVVAAEVRSAAPRSTAARPSAAVGAHDTRLRQPLRGKRCNDSVALCVCVRARSASAASLRSPPEPSLLTTFSAAASRRARSQRCTASTGGHPALCLTLTATRAACSGVSRRSASRRRTRGWAQGHDMTMRCRCGKSQLCMTMAVTCQLDQDQGGGAGKVRMETRLTFVCLCCHSAPVAGTHASALEYIHIPRV